MRPIAAPRCKAARAATGMSYALLLGLIAIAAIGSIATAGGSANRLLAQVSTRLRNAAPPPAPPPVTLSGDPRQWADGSAAASCLGYLQPPAGYAYAGSTGSGRYLLDPDGAAGPTAPFAAECDMTTDGGGWTLSGNLTSAPGAAGYSSIRSTQAGIESGVERIGVSPAGRVMRLSLTGTGQSGGFNLDLVTSSPLPAAFFLSGDGSYRTAEFNQVLSASNSALQAGHVLTLSATLTGYPYGGNGADSILQLFGSGSVPTTLTLAGRAFTESSAQGSCSGHPSSTLYTIIQQSGSGGFALKNSFNAGRRNGCNNMDTGDTRFTQMRLWYR